MLGHDESANRHEPRRIGLRACIVTISIVASRLTLQGITSRGGAGHYEKRATGFFHRNGTFRWVVCAGVAANQNTKTGDRPPGLGPDL